MNEHCFEMRSNPVTGRIKKNGEIYFSRHMIYSCENEQALTILRYKFFQATPLKCSRKLSVIFAYVTGTCQVEMGCCLFCCTCVSRCITKQRKKKEEVGFVVLRDSLLVSMKNGSIFAHYLQFFLF